MFFKTEPYRTAQQTDLWLWRTSWLLLLLFAVCQGLLALERSPSGDDAMFLSVPKNWLNGYGWATSYSEKIPFNPDFTGPTALLLLAAPLIKLFGNQLWIAGITGLLANLVLLSLCLLQIRHYWRNSGLAALALVCGMYASLPEDFASLIGYYSGSLAFLLACCIAFNPSYSSMRRASLVGLLAGFSLLLKSLLAPAFCLLCLAFLLQTFLQQRQKNTPTNSFIITIKPAIAILLPIAVLFGGWQWYRQHNLSVYSDEFRAAHAEYGREFFLHHGSGVGQWQAAQDKWLYVTRNMDRNLFHLENMLALHNISNPFLGEEPADIHHVAGIVFVLLMLVLTCISVWRAVRNSFFALDWCCAVLAGTVVIYTAWFLLFAMAMSPGHLYFPMQWALWLWLLLAASICPTRQTKGSILSACSIILLCIGGLMPVESRHNLLMFERQQMPRTDSIYQAADYLLTEKFNVPLVGCGYGGYPRHLEYLLPGSQNFSDCLDIIEDHMTKDSSGHFHWQSPPEFNIVFSLQTAGISAATARVLRVCGERVLYRNPDVQIFSCHSDALQTLDPDTLMAEIHKDHDWYRTRLMPWDGRYFPVFRP